MSSAAVLSSDRLALHSVIKNKRRIEEIKEIIDGKRSGKGKGSSEQQTVKNKLAELRGQFQTLVVRAQPPPPPSPAAAAVLHHVPVRGCGLVCVRSSRRMAPVWPEKAAAY